MASIIRGSDDFDSKDVNIGVAIMRVNFDGTGTPAVTDSFNVSSITDNGVGDYTVNFTTTLTDADYAYASTVREENVLMTGSNTTDAATGSLRVRTKVASTAAAIDTARVSIVIHGN